MGDHTCFRVNKTWEFPKLGTSFSNWRTHDNNELLDEVPVAQHAKIVPSSCSCTVGSGRLKFSSPSSFWKKVVDAILIILQCRFIFFLSQIHEFCYYCFFDKKYKIFEGFFWKTMHFVTNCFNDCSNNKIAIKNITLYYMKTKKRVWVIKCLKGVNS